MTIRLISRITAGIVCALLLAACDPAVDGDQSLQQQVSEAVAAASDLPHSGLAISAEAGIVTVSGSLNCEDCGGLQTPAGVESIQQSLGAVIRAVPGVQAVQFRLSD